MNLSRCIRRQSAVILQINNGAAGRMTVIKRPIRMHLSRNVSRSVSLLARAAIRSLSTSAFCAAIVGLKCSNDLNDKEKNPACGTIKVPDPTTLTDSFLLSQAMSIALVSSLNVLDRAVLVALEVHRDYQKVTGNLMDLIERSLDTLGNELEQDRLWELIVASRSLMDDKRKAVQELDALMTSAVKLVTSATETAFTIGCHDYLTTSASERIYFAELEVNAAKASTSRLEQAYAELNARSVKMTAEHDEKQKRHLASVRGL